MFDCNTFVEDVHHFHLLGIDKYRRYQRLAAEKFLSVLEERQYCPFPDCGAAFTVELFESENMVHCPECSNIYCVHCRGTDRCHCKDPVSSDIFSKLNPSSRLMMEVPKPSVLLANPVLLAKSPRRETEAVPISPVLNVGPNGALYVQKNGQRNASGITGLTE